AEVSGVPVYVYQQVEALFYGFDLDNRSEVKKMEQGALFLINKFDLIRAKDWSKTALGSIENWPQSLRTTVSLCLASNFPINIIWGPDAIQIYNLGYKNLCGAVHPRALGESFRVTWGSAWPVLGEPFERARLGKTSFLENQRMFLLRNGYLEEAFFTFSLSPIRNELGEVVGLFHPVTEMTSATLNQRRTRMLRDISSEAANSDHVSEALRRIVRTLTDYKHDLPHAFLCLENEEGKLVVQASTSDTHGLTDLNAWPIAEAYATGEPVLVRDVVKRFGKHPSEEYPEPIQHACVLPIKIPGQRRPLGFLMATLSTRLPLDETYLAFFDMLSNTVNGAIANAKANESAIDELTASESGKFAAEAATRSKSAFLANMSHEIRTPLSSILGFAEILKSPEVSAKDHSKYLDIISRNGQSLVRIIDDILDLSKIEADKLRIENDPLCLTELVNDVLAMFSDRAKGKGLTLTFDTHGLPNFKIESDAARIRQILVNLIGNAIKFTTRGGVSIRGSHMEIDSDRVGITLSIRDSGIGISNEQASQLFPRSWPMP
ncbi:MAG: histidine kinase dimerization/phospho-acceptor domain-containing protein, partial [Bdellovibrionota bacterium]